LNDAKRGKAGKIEEKKRPNVCFGIVAGLLVTAQ
jgi:hypothetical protein